MARTLGGTSNRPATLTRGSSSSPRATRRRTSSITKNGFPPVRRCSAWQVAVGASAPSTEATRAPTSAAVNPFSSITVAPGRRANSATVCPSAGSEPVGCGAVGGDEQERSAAGFPGDELEQPQRPAIGVVEIVEHDG